jgi:xanthine dehydrogenase YagS FAD-binding subunit
VADFYRAPRSETEREYNLEPNEVVTAVTIPVADLANATYKVRQRCGLDWPLVTASVAFKSVESARRPQIVLGFVAPQPWPAPKAAALLDGKRVTEELAAQAGEAAAAGATPLSKNAYKVTLVKTAVKRAILTAAGLMES